MYRRPSTLCPAKKKKKEKEKGQPTTNSNKVFFTTHPKQSSILMSEHISQAKASIQNYK